ncbi:MAG: ATP-sensitive inward rectifier potassium channel 10 [Leptolyngbyaceae cyanobacterium SM1_3_5]|nr:ATP-sensitive inward rectifier potassium channel 10 [Leptolyngbyaceae cyanobacterium SM1_3_5]
MAAPPSSRNLPDRSPPQTSLRPRLVNRSGSKTGIVRVGAKMARWRDPYHLLLTLSWVQYLILTFISFVAANALFAFLYLLGGDGIANAQPGSFPDAFFFSVQTMASIGYGAMYPTTTWANLVVTIEALTGLLGLAMATGLMFARFARPTARVLFSKNAVITVQDGLPTLMLRAANQRHNQVIEAQTRMTLVRNVTTPEGEFMRRFYDMKLVRSQTPVFVLTWTMIHPIDSDSPLYDLTPEDLAEIEAEVVVTLTGLDETFAQTIHARYSYIASEIQWNMRFEDILSRLPDGRRAVDYRRFHEVVPIGDRF